MLCTWPSTEERSRNLSIQRHRDKTYDSYEREINTNFKLKKMNGEWVLAK